MEFRRHANPFTSRKFPMRGTVLPRNARILPPRDLASCLCDSKQFAGLWRMGCSGACV
jgi:hypothetical protein